MKMFRVVVNGSEYRVGIEELVAESGEERSVQMRTIPPSRPAQPSSPAPRAQYPPQPISAGAERDGTIRAPLPGTVIRVAVSPGDPVSRGQSLLVLEAMKMENEIMAPADGVVQEVKVNQGVSVNAGDVLVVLAS